MVCVGERLLKRHTVCGLLVVGPRDGLSIPNIFLRLLGMERAPLFPSWSLGQQHNLWSGGLQLFYPKACVRA